MEDHLEKQVREGKQTSSFIADPVWVNAVAKVKAKYFEKFAKSDLQETATRESAYRLVAALADLEIELKKVIDGGTHAEHELKRAIRKP